MDPANIVTDNFLRATLENTHTVRDQCLQLLEISRRMSHFTQADVEETLPRGPDMSAAAHDQKSLYSHLGRLRGLNRNAVRRVRQTKHETAEARAEIDTLHLNLQNLFYEQRHLRGEISACDGYNHKYQSLPLLPLDEFIAARPEFDNTDDSTLMAARINHEFTEREALEQQRQGLLRKKQSLIAENKKRKDDLASLDQDLEKFIEAAKPIQKIFEKEY